MDFRFNFLRHISNRTKYDILLAKENFWKIENACEREEKFYLNLVRKLNFWRGLE